jgi:hypothetical protein
MLAICPAEIPAPTPSAAAAHLDSAAPRMGEAENPTRDDLGLTLRDSGLAAVLQAG